MFILILSPLSRVSGITILPKLMPFRKELGITMGMYALVHSALFFIASYGYIGDMVTQAWFIAGVLGMFLTLLLTITSNVWSMKMLGKNWKRLHRAVYVILILVLIHVVALSALSGRVNYSILIPAIFWLVLKLMDIWGIKLVRQ